MTFGRRRRSEQPAGRPDRRVDRAGRDARVRRFRRTPQDGEGHPSIRAGAREPERHPLAHPLRHDRGGHDGRQSAGVDVRGRSGRRGDGADRIARSAESTAPSTTSVSPGESRRRSTPLADEPEARGGATDRPRASRFPQVAWVLGVPPPGTNPDSTLVTLNWRFCASGRSETTVGNAGTSILDLVWQHRY